MQPVGRRWQKMWLKDQAGICRGTYCGGGGGGGREERVARDGVVVVVVRLAVVVVRFLGEVRRR